MTRTARNDSNTPSLKKLRIPPSQYWVVIEASKSKIIAPRKLVNSASASITGCALAAIAAGMPATGNQYLAITGEIDYPDDRIPESDEDELTSRLRHLLSSAVDDGTGIPTYSLETPNYSIRLRLLQDSATAYDWVRSELQSGNWRTREQVNDQTDELMRAAFDAIEAATGALPHDYDTRRTALIALHDHVRRAISRSFEPVMNKRAELFPQQSYEDKKTLAKWINAELRQFGLALKTTRTVEPCYIMGNPAGRPGIGRFYFEYVDENGRRQHPLTSLTLPYLELTLNDLSRGSYERSKSRSR